MFGIFGNKKRNKILTTSDNLLTAAKRVVNFYRDTLDTAAIESILEARDELAESLKVTKKISSEKDYLKLDEVNKKVDTLLRKHGGKIYPLNFWAENTDMILVAAFLALGFKTFFFQPFKIPTNSMFPTYSGLQSYIYEDQEESPGMLERGLNKLLYFANYHRYQAPVDGELIIPFNITKENGGYFPQGTEGGIFLEHETVYDPTFFIIPNQSNRYTLYIGDEPVDMQVPKVFDYQDLIRKQFYPQYPNFRSLLQDVFSNYSSLKKKISEKDGKLYLHTGINFKKGEDILEFDIQTGDMLFVDRISYNFVAPEIGDPFVFRTDLTPGLMKGPDSYYIKRLVGHEGDRLEVKDSTLMRNKEPIQGAEAFDKNAKRENGYKGYYAKINEGDGLIVDYIQDNSYYAMGDNSPNSGDSRTWGHVPQEALVGKAVFIFYPFTHRWGPSK